MQKYRQILVVMFSVAVLGLAGCATDGQYAPNVYSTGLQQQQVELGTVISVHAVTGRGGQMIGSLLGAVAGGLVGSSIGSGAGSSVAGIVGAAAGGIAGGDAQSHLMAKRETQVTVRLRSGQLIAVVEHARFSVGEKVQVIYTGDTTRVMPY